MELSQLKHFKATADYGANMTKAAEKLFLSQPALSFSIRKLEKELDLALFDRKKNKLYLNDAGQIVLNHTNRIFEELEQMQQELEVCRQNPGAVRFVTSAPGFMRYIMTRFQQADASYQYETEVLSEAKVQERLLGGDCDVAFAVSPLNDPAIVNIPFGMTKVYCSVDADHPLAQLHEIPFTSLAGETIVHFKADNYISDYMETYLKQIKANVIIERDPYLFENRTRLGNNIYFVTATYINMDKNHGHRKFIPIIKDGAALTHYFHILYPKGNSRKLRPFLDWLFQNYEEIAKIFS